MNIGNRLRQAIDDNNQKVTTFSDITGIPYVTLQQYLSNKRAPAAQALIKIYFQTNIDINWLLTGQGAMYRNPITGNIEDLQSKRHTALLQLYDALNEDQQREILAIAREKERLNNMERLLNEILKKTAPFMAAKK